LCTSFNTHEQISTPVLKIEASMLSDK